MKEGRKRGAREQEEGVERIRKRGISERRYEGLGGGDEGEEDKAKLKLVGKALKEGKTDEEVGRMGKQMRSKE